MTTREAWRFAWALARQGEINPGAFPRGTMINAAGRALRNRSWGDACAIKWRFTQWLRGPR